MWWEEEAHGFRFNDATVVQMVSIRTAKIKKKRIFEWFIIHTLSQKQIADVTSRLINNQTTQNFKEKKDQKRPKNPAGDT